MPNFEADARAALSAHNGLHLLIASGQVSKIAPTGVMQQIAKDLSEFSDRFTYVSVSGCGHEVGSNVMVFALLARAAIENQAANRTV